MSTIRRQSQTVGEARDARLPDNTLSPRRDIEQGGSGTFEVEDDGLDQKLLTKVSHLKTTNLGTRELLLRRMKKKYYQSQKFKSRNL